MYLDIVPVKSERRQLVEEQIRLHFSLFDVETDRRIHDLGPLLFLPRYPVPRPVPPPNVEPEVDGIA